MGTYPTLDAVRAALRERGPEAPEWQARMLHRVPDLPTVPDRKAYLVQKATGRDVLDLGCRGPIASAIRAVARTYYGVDRTPGAHVTAVVDLDATPTDLPILQVDCIIVSELLEHLANPGRCLTALRATYGEVETWITVPQAGCYQVRDGTYEVVNGEHVAYYSYTTLSTLLRRSGYTITLARWYHGPPHEAEGLIVQVR